MNIEFFLQEMNIQYELVGVGYFETLGLIGSKSNKPTCTFVEAEKFFFNVSEDITLILTNKDTAPHITRYNICIVENPRFTFFLLHNLLNNNQEYIRNSFNTKMDETAVISSMAYIAKKNVYIGKNSIIEEFVAIKENTIIGDNCIIRAGTVIGGEGFEQKRMDNEVVSIKHLGGVVVGNNVELQQNNTVDKAVFPWDNTTIGEYSRVDNLVHIAHAVKIGKRVLVAAHTCVAGRVNVGDDAWIGPGVTIINGISIGNGARVNIGSVATKDIPDGVAVTGNFAIDHKKFIRNIKEQSR